VAAARTTAVSAAVIKTPVASCAAMAPRAHHAAAERDRLLLLKGWVQVVGLAAMLGQVHQAVAICWLLTLVLGFCLAINRLFWCGAIVVVTAICYQAYIGMDWLLVYLDWGHLPAVGTNIALAYAGLTASILGTIWGHAGSLDELVERKIRDLHAPSNSGAP
jgi:hypothetical protein